MTERKSTPAVVKKSTGLWSNQSPIFLSVWYGFLFRCSPKLLSISLTRRRVLSCKSQFHRHLSFSLSLAISPSNLSEAASPWQRSPLEVEAIAIFSLPFVVVSAISSWSSRRALKDLSLNHLQISLSLWLQRRPWMEAEPQVSDGDWEFDFEC